MINLVGLLPNFNQIFSTLFVGFTVLNIFSKSSLAIWFGNIIERETKILSVYFILFAYLFCEIQFIIRVLDTKKVLQIIDLQTNSLIIFFAIVSTLWLSLFIFLQWSKKIKDSHKKDKIKTGSKLLLGLLVVLMVCQMPIIFIIGICLSYIILLLLSDMYVSTKEVKLSWLIVWNLVINLLFFLLLFQYNGYIYKEKIEIQYLPALVSLGFIWSLVIASILAVINGYFPFISDKYQFHLKNRKLIRNRVQFLFIGLLGLNFLILIIVTIFQMKFNFNISDQLIKNLVWTFLTSYVILFLLAYCMALWLSNYISFHIKSLGTTLKNVKLKENLLLEANENDEIGSLIKDYNTMVQNLESNVRLMAMVERDNAWNEMSRQIAHEIKNPLTPMKLNLQYLQQNISIDSTTEWKSRINRVCETLLEQINNLNQIADEFSNFGTLPKSQNKPISLNDVALSVFDLFRNKSDLEMIMHEPLDDITVHADRGLLVRILNNIMKNAIQAIPSTRRGKIEISIYKKENSGVIEIADNGSGIKEEMKLKIFQPNFTTKTSGSGLGLAICKNIVETFGGNISFLSNSPLGTKFFVEIPLVNLTSENLEIETVYLD